MTIDISSPEMLAEAKAELLKLVNPSFIPDKPMSDLERWEQIEQLAEGISSYYFYKKFYLLDLESTLSEGDNKPT